MVLAILPGGELADSFVESLAAVAGPEIFIVDPMAALDFAFCSAAVGRM